MHFLSSNAGIHLLALRERVRLVSGGDGGETADDEPPRLFALPRRLPLLPSDRDPARSHGRRRRAA